MLGGMLGEAPRRWPDHQVQAMLGEASRFLMLGAQSLVQPHPRAALCHISQRHLYLPADLTAGSQPPACL
jgi:hypothetical protein